MKGLSWEYSDELENCLSRDIQKKTGISSVENVLQFDDYENIINI